MTFFFMHAYIPVPRKSFSQCISCTVKAGGFIYSEINCLKKTLYLEKSLVFQPLLQFGNTLRHFFQLALIHINFLLFFGW